MISDVGGFWGNFGKYGVDTTLQLHHKLLLFFFI